MMPRPHITPILAILSLGAVLGCGSTLTGSNGSGSGGGAGLGTGGGAGARVGQGGGGGQAGGGPGGHCATCQSGAATACPAGVSAGTLCSGTLQTCCAGGVGFQCGCNTINCAWSPICPGGTGGAGAGGGGGAGAGGSGVGGGAGAGGVSGYCNSDTDCAFRTTGCCEESCMATTDPVPTGTVVCNILCLAPTATLCGCVNNQCTDETGAGGQGGAGDGAAGSGGGAAGSGGSGGANCTDLQTEYAAALPAAESCTVGASGQCQQRVGQFLPPFLCNTGCSDLFVNDASILAPIISKWEQSGCPRPVCPAIACGPPPSETCVPVDGGGGVCSLSGLGTAN